MGDFQDKRILVTGATGFLGSMLAQRFASEGGQVVVLARSNESADAATAQGFEVARGDVTNRESLRRAMENCAIVVHCAASFGHPDDQRDVNVNGTRLVAEEVGFGGVRQLVYVSSIAVYGFARRGVVNETVAPTPGSYIYARTKLGGENAIKEVAIHTGLNYTIVRLSLIHI